MERTSLRYAMVSFLVGLVNDDEGLLVIWRGWMGTYGGELLLGGCGELVGLIHKDVTNVECCGCWWKL